MIALLTKADYLYGVAIGELRDSGKSMKEAMHHAADVEKMWLHELKNRIVEGLRSCKSPPKCYLSLASKLMDIMLNLY